MSFDALAWAAKAKGVRPAEKLVLLGLAENASRDDGIAHPSISALIEFSGLNRKTVIGALSTLTERGLISETGDAVGRTNQIKVYRLHMERVPETALLERGKSSEKGTVGSGKESQKRDTEPVIYISSEDKSSSDNAQLRPEHIEETWNETASRLWRGRTIKGLVNGRRVGVKRLIASHELGDFIAVFANIEQSKFLRGDTGWHGCTFDWVMKPANFQKILEGNYNG